MGEMVDDQTEKPGSKSLKERKKIKKKKITSSGTVELQS
jgi:hypothetical protein